jgi:hypothetical protein
MFATFAILTGRAVSAPAVPAGAVVYEGGRAHDSGRPVAAGGAVDEQAAAGDHPLAGAQALHDLDQS